MCIIKLLPKDKLLITVFFYLDQFLNTKVLHGIEAMHLRCNGIFSNQFIATLLLSTLVKEIWTLVNIYEVMGKSKCPVFWLTR